MCFQRVIVYRTLHPVATLPAPYLTTSDLAVAPGNNNSVFRGETAFAADCIAISMMSSDQFQYVLPSTSPQSIEKPD